jgi:transposase
MTRYKLRRSTIDRILRYDVPERSRITRTGRPSLLTDTQVNEIIEYLSESWEHRILDYTLLRNELQLDYSIETLERRLKQQGYFRYVACQKPYLTAAQVLARFLWAITHIFWTTE